MAFMVTCPQCAAKLQLARPAIGPAKVKCRLCRASFYAVCDAEMGPILPPKSSPETPAIGVVAQPMARATIAPPSSGGRRRHRSEEPFPQTRTRDLIIGTCLIAALVAMLGGFELYLLMGWNQPLPTARTRSTPTTLNLPDAVPLPSLVEQPIHSINDSEVRPAGAREPKP